MNDLIRRSDAINLCGKWRNRTNEHHDKNGWYIADTLLKAIKELPSADRPQGEWKEKTKFHNADDDPIIEEWQSAKCSVCGKYHTTPYLYYFNDFNYCPNCGCQMKGVDDEA